MNKSLEGLQIILETIKTKFKDKIIFDRVECSQKDGYMEVFFNTKKHFLPSEYLKLYNTLKKQEIPNVSLKLTQKEYKEEFYANSDNINKYVKDFLIVMVPSLFPYVKDANVAILDNVLIITLKEDIAKGIFKSMEVPSKCKKFFANAYDIELNVSLLCDESVEDSYIPIIEEVQTPQISQKPTAQIQHSDLAVKKANKLPETITKLSDLEIENTYTVEGEIVYYEKRSIKDGQYTKHKFVICDYTKSINCEIFEGDKFKLKYDIPKLNKWYKIKGKYTKSEYEREPFIKILDVENAKGRQRRDNADEKRVELHVHTNMSTQDGVCAPKAIVAKAAEFGQTAVAITDHGVVQAFPEASGMAKKLGIKLIYGCEGYLINESILYKASQNADFNSEFVVFDIETTGFSPIKSEITEIAGVRVVNGEIKEAFSSFVKTQNPIPPGIVALTGITDDMLKDAPPLEKVLTDFKAFCKDAILVAHNADFDTSFVFHKSLEFNITYENTVLDSIDLCKVAFPGLGKYKLNLVAKELNIPLSHHRALNDADCTAKIMLRCFKVFEKDGICDFFELNKFTSMQKNHKGKYYHIILLCKNKRGLRNLYKLISHAHIDYFYRRPRMPKSLIAEHREGLIIGSACESGELYKAIMKNTKEEELIKIASFYDYLEIQPASNNSFMVKNGTVEDVEAIKAFNKKIVMLGEKLNIPVVATTDAHYTEPHEDYFRRIILHNKKFKDNDKSFLYMRTTEEMLEEFAYLGKEKAYEVVVANTKKIAEMCEEIELFQSDTAMPKIEGADEEIVRIAYSNAKKKYGDPLPEVVEARLKRELDSIVNHGFSVLYYSAHKLVKKSLEDGYLVGSRGSVGSSFAATMLEITEVNPLAPHYVCPNCKHSDFNVDIDVYACGVDLPDKQCEKCGEKYIKDGFDIPFEVFLGINADKVPDIDLNFSGEYQSRAHKYTEELFGKYFVFRAGTISSVQEKTAYGYVKNFLDETGQTENEAEVNRLVKGVAGVKRTTGQHPGGMVIVPRDREIYEFTPVQKPADDMSADTITTHFDFNSMHDILIKLDILGHDVPTFIRILQDLTEMDPLKIPLDDKPTMELFSGTKSLGINPKDMFDIKTGTLGIPEFGTSFVIQMLRDTLPTTMGEIVRISGLSHGTDVWISNAQDLIKEKVVTLKEAICTRDDIMNYLVHHGMEKRTAFFIMENVRKGKGLTEDMKKSMEDCEIPEWFVNSCLKIKYMFPKAHAVAYVTMAYRIAYCKVHHPKAFYAAYFSIHSDEFDATYVLGGLDDIKKQWEQIKSKGKNAAGNEKSMMILLEIACEMYLRGIHFLPVDLSKSDDKRFLVEGNGLRLPFITIPSLGATVATAIITQRQEGAFISVEDLKSRSKVTQSAIDEMQKMGTLVGLSQSNQLSLFDF